MFDQIWTVPNAVSFVRLAAIPYFWFVLIGQDRVGLAALLIFLIGATDWVDGWLARKLGQESEFGAFLDPLADRLMIVSAVIGGLVAGVLPTVIGVPLIAREALVALGAAYHGLRGGSRLQVRYLGKVATFLLYGAIPSFYLAAAGVAAGFFAAAAWIAGWLGVFLYWWVAASYAGDIRRTVS